MASQSTISLAARQKFGLDVRAKRGDCGQSEFAKSLHLSLSQGTLSKIESGDQSISAAKLRALAKKLDFQMDLKLASVDPPSRCGCCENPDCHTVSIGCDNTNLFFVPTKYRIESVRGKCPVGHPLNTKCKSCGSPIDENSTHLCSSCGQPLIDLDVVRASLFSAVFLADFERLKASKASSLLTQPSEDLRRRVKEFAAEVGKENEKRDQLLSRLTRGL